MTEEHKQAFTDAWNILKKYNKLSDEEWQLLLDEENKLIKGYKDQAFVKDLLYAVNNELGRMNR